MSPVVALRWTLVGALAALASGCSIDTGGLYVARPADAGTDALAAADAGTPEDASTPRDAPTTRDAGCEPTEACDSAGDDDCDGIVDEGCAWHFGRPSPLVSLHRSTGYHYSPVLTADGRRLYFRAEVAGGPDLWVASRGGVETRFGEPEPVDVVGADTLVMYSFTLSDDELELIVEATREGSGDPTHLYRSVRASPDEAFGMPLEIGVLSAAAPWRDINPHLSRDGTEIFFASDRTGQLRLYRASRPEPGMAFTAPVPVTLPGTGSVEATPHLSRDGLTLFFSRDWRLYRAERPTRDTASFADPVKIAELPDDGSTYFPHVSESTYEIFFISERPWSPATSAIWRARLCRAGPCDEPTIDCPSDGATSPDGRHCYFGGAGAGTWAEARTDCLAAGGDLVSIHSHAEQETAWNVVATEMWTGGNDIENECNTTIADCTFDWSTGEPFLYADWPIGQPDDAGGEDCLVLNFNVVDRFNDRACSTSLPFVCERELWPW